MEQDGGEVITMEAKPTKEEEEASCFSREAEMQNESGKPDRNNNEKETRVDDDDGLDTGSQ